MTWDAVVVVPGIMGSELVDAATGDVLWGFRRLGWHVRAWGAGDGLRALHVTEDELDGRVGRVRPTGLLRFPAVAPWLAGLEPYTALVRAIRRVVVAPDAVLEFGYDWRLSVAHNAGLLAEAAISHLASWRDRSGRRDARLVLVAHSMGGLLCRVLAGISGAADDVRCVITLGTPFDGAAKAALILGTGRGTSLPHGRLRALAAGLPGIHDLLPTYRCVDDGDDVRPLTPRDVGRLGGSVDLARAALDRDRSAPLPGHRALIGIQQPTISSLTLAGRQRDRDRSAALDAMGSTGLCSHTTIVRAFPGRIDGRNPCSGGGGKSTTGTRARLSTRHEAVARGAALSLSGNGDGPWRISQSTAQSRRTRPNPRERSPVARASRDNVAGIFGRLLVGHRS